MAGFRLLDLIKPFQRVLPEIENPVSQSHISFDDRILYSIGIGILYELSQVPVYGVKAVNSDPFFGFRSFFGAERGTLAEFGLLPVITAGLLWQLLAGFKLVSVNFSSRVDRGYFQSLQKITSIILGGVYAFVLVFLTNYYNPNAEFLAALQVGSSVDAGFVQSNKSLLIWLQLFLYNSIVTLLVEILDKDYGFSSGSLFLIAVDIAGHFVGSLFGPTGAYGTKGYEYKGAILQLVLLVKNVVTGVFSSAPSTFSQDFIQLVNRVTLVNLKQVVLGIAAFLVIFYLQAFHYAVSIKSKQVKTMSQTYPIKLFFNGALPLVFAFSVLFNIKIAAYSVFKFFSTNPVGKSFISGITDSQPKIVRAIVNFVVGDFSSDAFSYVSPEFSRTYQTAGIGSLFQAPASLTDAVLSPIKSTTYSAAVFALVYFFSKNWSKISGSSGKDLAEFFSKQNITLLGKRDVNLSFYFAKLVSSASLTGGLILAAITIVTDFLGAEGFAAEVLIAVLITFAFLEEFFTAFQQSGGNSSLYNGAFGQGIGQ